MSTKVVLRVPSDARLPDNDQWENRFEIRSATSDRVYVVAQHRTKRHGRARVRRGARGARASTWSRCDCPPTSDPTRCCLGRTAVKRAFLDGYRTSTSPRGSAATWRAALAARMGLDEAREVLGDDSPEGVLGVAPGASWAEVKSAYRAAALACHPDRAVLNGMSVEAATARFKRVQAAYTVLEERRTR